jgi:mannose-6-phosphate isomerase-like protein (cupin superfamily)
MKITSLDSASKVPFNLDGHKMYSGDKVEIVHLSLKPGEEISLHANPIDVVFFILEGSGTIFFEGESFNVSANNSIYIEKDKQRGMRNSSEDIFRVLVIKIS